MILQQELFNVSIVFRGYWLTMEYLCWPGTWMEVAFAPFLPTSRGTMLSICCLIFSQGCSMICSESVSKENVRLLDQNISPFVCRTRGVLAEGAQFMMMSPQYDYQRLVHPELKEIRSFNFFRLINPQTPDLVNLEKKLGICGHGLPCK